MSAAEIADYLFSAMRDDLDSGRADAGEALAIEADFTSAPRRAINAMAQYVLRFAKDFTENERAAIKRMILDALESGSGAAELKRLIKGYFAEGIHYLDDNGDIVRTVNLDAWADTVARTELARAYTMGQVSLYQDVGVEKVMWVAAGDPGECPECEAADGQVVSLGDTFPGVDVDQPPAHPRCYCTLVSAQDEITRYNEPDAAAARAEQLAYYRSIN